ncbi:MAG: hypothetical protein ING71_18280 [Rhodocyclaceae bacterium]|nr:hypothetical protein [Rhodocyclaceae bacterium]MCA3087982.1 hypothetical protein [Rhodocyclaceae bacterium]
MHLKYILCQIQSNYLNLFHDASSYFWWLMTLPLWHFEPLQVGGVHFINFLCSKYGCRYSMTDAGGRPRCLAINAGDCPAASFFLLLRQMKETKEKATRFAGPSGCPLLLRAAGHSQNSGS